MVPVTPTFPLWKLPLLAWKNVFATMDPLDLITSSMCSNQFKRSLRTVLFHCSNYLVFYICDHRFVLDIRGRSTNFKFVLSSLISKCSLQVEEEHSILAYTANEWITQLMELFNCENINLAFMVCRTVEPEFVHTAVHGHKIHKLHMVHRNHNLKKIVELFVPTYKLHLNHRPEHFESLVYLRDLEYIHLMFSVSYEELLVMNNTQLEIWTSVITTAQFNSYLKDWLAGSLAPKLQRLYIRLLKDNFSENYTSEILDGIDYRLVEEEQVCVVPCEGAQRRFKNGYNVTKKDGRKVWIYFVNTFSTIVEVNVLVLS